jgi:pilus assembly protein CpaB
MMRPKSLILLGLALGCGLVASIGISQVLDGKNKAAVVTVPIYVALQNINLGDPVDDSMVKLEEWPKDKVPIGAIAKWEDLEDRRPRTVIFEGEALLDGKFLPKGQSHDPIAAIPPGMRLKTVAVDAEKSAAGLLSPGDRVDLQLYVKKNEREGISSSFTKVILQNIRVFAVDQAVQRSADNAEARMVAKTVSLIVTTQQANRVTLAENIGEISLIPRHPDDDQIVEDSEQSIDDLLARSDANNRELEQGKQVKDEAPEPTGVLDMIKGAIEQETVVEADPPFRMKVIYPDSVQELHFSAETGEPLEPVGENLAVGEGLGAEKTGAVGSGSDQAPPSESEPETEAGYEDFPIDLKQE